MDKKTSSIQANDTGRRGTVSIWLLLIGVVAFVVACYLLLIEDAVQVRTTLPPLRPRSEALTGGTRTIVIDPTSRASAPVRATPVAPSVPPVATATTAAVSPGDTSAFPEAFIEGLWREADAAGIRRGTFDRAFAIAARPDPSVLALNATQPEFDRTTGDYVTAILTADRVVNGRNRLDQSASVLSDIERRFGVDRAILVAVWGLETNYGAVTGERNIVRSLASLASFEPRRSGFWRSELLAALTILEQDRIEPERFVGSWAGAMGHTQLMPTAFLRYAVDFDAVGRRDVWTSAANALASTARFLQSNGWVAKRPWGIEIVLPSGFDYGLSTRSAARNLAGWSNLGVRAQTGVLPIDDSGNWRLLLPAGATGPAFLVSQNFDALLAYNPAVSYALAAGALSDRIAGRGSIVAAWPVGDVALTRDQRIEMQDLLAALGIDVGPIDGIIGPQTYEAIRAYQKTQSIPADGHPSLALLNRLRSTRRL